MGNTLLTCHDDEKWRLDWLARCGVVGDDCINTGKLYWSEEENQPAVEKKKT